MQIMNLTQSLLKPEVFRQSWEGKLSDLLRKTERGSTDLVCTPLDQEKNLSFQLSWVHFLCLQQKNTSGPTSLTK